MPIVFTCPTCGHTFSVPDEFAGRTASCNKCGAKFTIPDWEEKPPARVSQPSQPVVRVQRKHSSKSSQALTWVLVCITLILLGGATSAYFMFRDTWEQDNKAKILDMKNTADVYYANGLYAQAKAEYKALIYFAGDKPLKDPQLTNATRNARAKLLDLDLQDKKTLAQQAEETDKKLKEAEKEAARLAKEKEIAEKKRHAEEIRRLREETRLQGEVIKKMENEEDAKEAIQTEQERLEAEKRLAEAKLNDREAAARLRATVQPVVVRPKPADTKTSGDSGEECPLCLGLKKGNITINDTHIWYDQLQPNVVVRIIPRLLFTPAENGTEICPACAGKGRGVGIPSTNVLTRDLPPYNSCKNCDGFGKLLKYKADNKSYGYPYGSNNNRCSRCLGTGLTPGSISTGKK